MSELIRIDREGLRELVREVAREELHAVRAMPRPTYRYLSAAEAADILGVSERTVQRMCLSGALPAVQVGNRWKVRRSDLPVPTGSE